MGDGVTNAASRLAHIFDSRRCDAPPPASRAPCIIKTVSPRTVAFSSPIDRIYWMIRSRSAGVLACRRRSASRAERRQMRERHAPSRRRASRDIPRMAPSRAQSMMTRKKPTRRQFRRAPRSAIYFSARWPRRLSPPQTLLRAEAANFAHIHTAIIFLYYILIFLSSILATWSLRATI